ncbi:MAG TPA: proteasome subunit beta [Candidatus Nanoarchaeia archaeon]|nr:proteasome subunit beta [Candidatus Nanoarchaeia archaeon]
MDAELKNSILRTGTSLVGIVCRDGIVMASDRQVTGGRSLVLNKNFQKTNPINEYLVVSWAGQVSGAQRLSKMIAAELKLKELRSKSRPTVKQSANLVATLAYNGIRQPSMVPDIVDTFIGGFNEDGTTELYEIGADGALIPVKEYIANGSGMFYILGLLERQYKKNLSVEDGVKLAVESIKSSTQRDVYSGYGIDVFTITKEGIKKVVEQTIEPEYKDDKRE